MTTRLRLSVRTINEVHVRMTPGDAARLRNDLEPWKTRNHANRVRTAIEQELLTGSDTVVVSLDTWAAAHAIELIDDIEAEWLTGPMVMFRGALLHAFIGWASTRLETLP